MGRILLFALFALAAVPSPSLAQSHVPDLIMAIGQNLLEAGHHESPGTGPLLLVAQVRRSASLRVRWTFQ